MMPILFDVQSQLITSKSASENVADVKRCVAAIQQAAATHDRFLAEHWPNGDPKYKAQPKFTQLPGGVIIGKFGIQTGLMRRKPTPDDNAYDVAGCLQACVHALALINLILLQHHPQLPGLYDSGIRYQTDPNAWKAQTMKSIPTVLEQGGTDCKNLDGYELAFKWREELLPPPMGFGCRMSRAKIYWRFLENDRLRKQLPADILASLPAQGPIPQGRLFHAQMRSPDQPWPRGYTTPDGEVTDQSRLLGM